MPSRQGNPRRPGGAQTKTVSKILLQLLLYFMDQYLGGKANIQEKHGCELHLVSDHITLQAYK